LVASFSVDDKTPTLALLMPFRKGATIPLKLIFAQ